MTQYAGETDPAAPLRVFVSYAAEDDEARINLEKFLRPDVRNGLIDIWHDRKLLPGDRFGDVIAEQLEESDLVALLVSPDFLSSDYIHEKEMRRALERHESGEVRVIPILLDDCRWKSTPLRDLHVIPDRARPVAAWDRPAEAWTKVAEEFVKIAKGVSPPTRTIRVPEARRADPTRYLQSLREEHTYVEVRGMGARVAEQLELQQVYTRLTVAAPGGAERPKHGRRKSRDVDSLGERREEDHHRQLEDVLAEHRHMALVGDPGSGKTTFLRYVAQNLARARLGDAGAAARLGLDTGEEPPFPVFIKLEKLARFLTDHGDSDFPDEAPEHFHRYLRHMLAGHHYGLPDAYLCDRVRDGGCFLLLDGLDEVPGQELRERLVRLIEKVVVAGKEANRHLITCRSRAYEGQVQLREDVTTFRLAPFQRAQVERFVEGWSRALFRVGAGDVDSPQAARAADCGNELLAAIDMNPSGATFSASPLMLTVLAVVHWNRKRLPQQRAELYDAAVEYLLESRRELSDYATPLRRECLQAVAMAMFEDREGVQRSMGRMDAANAAVRVLGVERQAALEFLENEELYSGVLVSRTAGEVEFWHLTFQEYLAALELAQDDEGWSRLAAHLFDDRWSEVVLLYAGCVRRLRGGRAAGRLLQRVLNTGSDPITKARAVGMAARILNDIRPYGGDPAQGTTYEDDLSETLAIFEPGGQAVAEFVRVEVGEALGQAGDPRLTEPAARRILIPGGSFWMGAQSKSPEAPGFDKEADDDEAPVRLVTVSAFTMGRFPVTVQEYRRFVDAGDDGYLNPRLWDSSGWAWREKEQVETPGGWSDQLRHPNRPVTGVSWFEADAYCRWVHGRLPTEAEWEWAARGAEARRFPWGPEKPTADHANMMLNVGEPSPVGIYPLGATPEGVQDLAGNVFEWCADWFGQYDPDLGPHPKGPSYGTLRVLRGGSFNFVPLYLRASYRGSVPPGYRGADRGFRVVWSLAGGRALPKGSVGETSHSRSQRTA